MRKVLLIFVFVLFSSSAVCGLTCTVRNGACLSGQVGFFKMSSTSNAHASLLSVTDYTYTVCCSGLTGLGTSCSASPFEVLLRLSGDTDAHVQANGYTNYPDDICISGGCADTLDVVYADTSCPTGYDCMVSISSDDNAHVGNCNYDTRKVCIKAVDHLSPAVDVSHRPSTIYSNTDVIIEAVGTTYDSTTVYRIRIYIDGALAKTCTASPCNVTNRYPVGAHNYYATIIDSCNSNGRDPASGALTFNVLHRKPSASIIYAPSNPIAMQPITFTATGTAYDGAYIKNITIYVNNARLGTTCTFASGATNECIRTASYPAGTYQYYTNVTDSMGATTKTTTRTFTVGPPIIPVCTVTHTPADPNSQDQVNFTAKCQAYGVAYVKNITIFVDGRALAPCTYASGAIRECNRTAGPYSVGSHQYYAVGFDNLGNKDTTAIETFDVEHAQPEIIGITITPANPYTQDTIRFDITGQSYDREHIKRIQLVVDGNGVGRCDYADGATNRTTCTITRPPGNYSVGNHDYYARIWDYLNAYSRSPDAIFTVRHTPPRGNIVHQPANPTTANQVNFTAQGTAYDGYYLRRITVYVDGVRLGATCTFVSGATHQCLKIGGPYTEGAHTYYALFNDSSGTANRTATRSFTVTHAPPAVTASHQPANPTTFDTVNITGRASAYDGASISRIRIYTRAAGQTTWTLRRACAVSASPAECNYSQSYSEGNYQYYVNATDSRSTTGNSTVSSFRVSRVPLNITQVQGWACPGLQKIIKCNVTADRDVNQTVDNPLGCRIEDLNGNIISQCIFDRWFNRRKAGFNCITPSTRGDYKYVGFVEAGNAYYSQGYTSEMEYTLDCNCRLLSAVADNSSCTAPRGTCFMGENIRLNVTYTGGCVPASNTLYLQIDASDSNNICNIAAVGGQITGMNTVCTGRSPCSGLWTIPNPVPDRCKGKTLLAKASGLWEGGPAGQGTYITGTNPTGRFKIYSPTAGDITLSVNIVFLPSTIVIRGENPSITIEVTGRYSVQGRAYQDCTQSECSIVLTVDGASVIPTWSGGGKWTYTIAIPTLGPGYHPVNAVITYISTGDDGSDSKEFIVNRRPSISNVQSIPQTVSPGQTVTIQADVRDDDTFLNGDLDENSVAVCKGSIARDAPCNQGYYCNSMSRVSGDTFACSVPTGSLASNNYRYTIKARDNLGYYNKAESSFTVSTKTIDITVNYPYADAMIIDLSSGYPNFTRSMPVEFFIRGEIRGGLFAEKCTKNNCEAYYRIGAGSWIKAEWDEFEQAFNGTVDSSQFACDQNTAMDVMVTKIIDPDIGLSRSIIERFYVNCIPKVTVMPKEAKFALNEVNKPDIFLVTLWNPQEAGTYTIDIESLKTPQAVNWIKFDCTTPGLSSCIDRSATFDIDRISSKAIPVDLRVAGRVGFYYMDFKGYNTASPSTKYTDTAMLLIFSEGLPEFTFIHFIVLIITAVLLVYLKPWEKEFSSKN